MGDNIPNTEPSTTVNPVFDPDKFHSEVEKSLEDRQQYSSGTGIFRKLYDDNNTLENPLTEPSGDNVKDLHRYEKTNNYAGDNVKDLQRYEKTNNYAGDNAKEVDDSRSWYQKYYEDKNSTSAGLVVTAGNLQVDFSKIDRIIEILKEVKDSKILTARSYVGDQVMLINNVHDFTSAVGRLDSTDINQPLTNLAAKIEKLINDYEYVKGEVKKYNSNSTGALAGAFTTLIGRNNSSSSEPPVENVWRPSSTTTTTSTEAPTDVKTPKTTPQTEVKTTPTTERPTVPVTTEPTTTTPQTTEPVKHGGPLPSIPVNRNTNGNGTSGGGYYWNGSGNGTNNTVTTEAPTVATEATFDIKEGNKYKLPTSSRPTIPTTQPTTSSKGNSVIPVLAGLSAAAAAGIGAKAYMDRKKNNDNESEEEFKSEDWSDNNDINIEYQEPVTKEAETLEFDDVNDNYEVETPEKYGAKTHQELEDLQ